MKSLALSQIRQREIPKIVGHLVLVTVLKNSKKIESVIKRLKKVDEMKGDDKAIIKGYKFLLDKKTVSLSKDMAIPDVETPGSSDLSSPGFLVCDVTWDHLTLPGQNGGIKIMSLINK